MKRIRENMEAVRISRKLATICCEVPIDVSPETVRYRRAHKEVLHPLCKELGFVSVIDEIPLSPNRCCFSSPPWKRRGGRAIKKMALFL